MSLGIRDLHCVNPTCDGSGDLFGRNAQFIRDASVAGGLEVYAKSGTWGPIYADAGIMRHIESGRQMVIVVFTEANPAYRGDFIADLTERSARRLLRR